LSGTNKDYIDRHIPHLSEIITNDLDHVLENSDTLVITQRMDEYAELPKKYPDKKFIDLVRIADKYRELPNVEGICW
jgi:GDP-mannose 6-dehydrogenase